MAEESPTQRVSPVVFPKSWELPGRPDDGNPVALDAFRQTEFQLRPDLRLLHEGMNLVLRVIADSYPSKFRTYRAAAVQLFWSRTFHCLSDAALLVTRGSYAGVPPLVRTACECHSAAVQLGGDELFEFELFLARSLKPHEHLHATEIGRGSYHAGGTLAADETLGRVYRASTELGRPHFGATLIEVAPESNQQKLAVLFGDQAFHFGWAQLELGWLIALCSVVLRHAQTLADASVLGASEETLAAVAAFLDRAERTLAAPDRCRIDEVEEEFEPRFLISNFRRQSGGAPRRLLL
ncbi:MAG TPA: hypothetical protein VH916_13435 [Dehalococcoidia bacterium]